MDKDLDLVHAKASKSEEVSPLQEDAGLPLQEDDVLRLLSIYVNGSTPEEYLKTLRFEASKREEAWSCQDASNPEKASSCRYDDLNQIKDRLFAYFPSKLTVIPIVGMGGIGKTTLANCIYEDAAISYHFHLRAWVTVSPEYDLRNVLLDLLKSMGLLADELSEMETEDLAPMLFRCLKRRKYLIVLDDVWSTETWNDFKRIFPDDDTGSRIILTTRLQEVAACADLDGLSHYLKCLSSDESWRLLCNELFVGKPCPPDLAKIGTEIAKKCQGLPLAIIVVAGHLSKIDIDRDCWADFEKRLNSLVTRNQEPILDILCLSYSHLPRHLKACFLYMGIFPKNSEVLIAKVIRLWSAVGFLNAECRPESIEDEAEKCMEDLISRNLITVKTRKFDGTAQTCAVHDLLWDLILRESQKEGHYIFGQSDLRQSYSSTSYDIKQYLIGKSIARNQCTCTVCFDKLYPHFRVLNFSRSIQQYLHVIQSINVSGTHAPNASMNFPIGLASSYLYFKGSPIFGIRLISDCFRLLKVLDIHFQSFNDFPDVVTDIVSLIYLELATHGNIPGSISKLRNLETLINDHKWAGPILPKEIWLLRRLRHLHVGTCTFLPKASGASFDGSSVPVLPHLQTLSTISFASCTEQVLSSIPNLKRLKLHEMGEEDEHLFDCLNNLICLCQLEKLNLYFSKEMRRHPQNLRQDIFPPGVKKLTLSGSHLPWEDMNTLAMLPNLEVLKLKDNAFKGPIYKQPLEGFHRLKVLKFENLDLQYWIADSDTIHFPVLQNLVLKFCKSLKEIPVCLGELTTLKYMELRGCSGSANKCARTIQEEQKMIGNEDLQVHIGIAVVLRLEFPNGEILQKAMRTASGLPGIGMVAVKMEDNKMIVTGDMEPLTKLASKYTIL